MPEYSVVIPALNSAGTIERAILSVRSQSLKVAEIIVVDDGSSDNTAQLAEKMGASVIRNSTTLGSGISRLKGFSRVKTPFVATLDSDDEWKPNMAEVILLEMTKNDADIFGCDLQIIKDGFLGSENRNLPHQEITENGFSRQLVLLDFLFGSPLASSGTFFRTSIVTDSALHEEVEFAEDYWLLCKALIAGKSIWKTPRILGFYHLSQYQKSNDVKAQSESRLGCLEHLIANDPRAFALGSKSADKCRLRVAFSYWARLAASKSNPPNFLALKLDSRIALTFYKVASSLMSSNPIWHICSFSWRAIVRIKAL